VNGLLKGARDTVVPLLVSAVVSVGFVAFAGKAVLWARFNALHVPPDQVVKAVPQSEAVAVGASILLIFGFFGAIAALMTYLVDRGGRATPGMIRAILALVTLEAVAMIVIASELSPWERALLGALVLVPAGLAIAATFARPLVDLQDTLPPRPSETLGPERDASLLIDGAGKLRADPLHLSIVCGSVVLALGLGALLLLVQLPAVLVVAVGAEILTLLVLAALLSFTQVGWDRTPIGEIRASLERERIQEAALGDNEATVFGQAAERRRIGKRRPYRFAFGAGGAFLVAFLAVVSTVTPVLALHKLWFTVSMGSAVVLGFGLWRIAGLSKQLFVWFGFAVFISVPLFGTLTLMARNLDDPQVQPMALIRETDRADEAIQGLYVTEADKRVYFATVATEGCDDDKVRDNSGRLLWVPKSEVVAMSIGPPQSVDDAAKSSLEMAYALTPAVETPSGDLVGSESPETAGDGGELEAKGPEGDQRLENVGPAVRADFGAGLSLEPKDVSPGQKVTLRMAKINTDVEGFGSQRGNHVLRLGGVKVDIARQKVKRATDAEYVVVKDGTALEITRRHVYTKVDGEYVPYATHRGEGIGRFVKVTDDAVIGVDDGRLADEKYLRLDGHDRLMDVPRGTTPGLVSSLTALAARPFELVVAKIWGDGPEAAPRPEPMVTLQKGHRKVALARRLWRDDWHKDHIRFKVPGNATKGPVTVECDPLAGQPVLLVHRPPTARIAVRMAAGSKKIEFDSRRSADRGGEVKSRRWTVSGLVVGHKGTLSHKLPPRLAPYRIKLTVTDDEDESDSAELHLLRLPAPFFRFGDPNPESRKALKRIRRTLRRAVAEAPPVAIEIAGHADDVGRRSHNLTLSLERATNVRDALLTPAFARELGVAGKQVPVTTRAFGETCPVDRSGGRLRVNRRVEVFVLGRGSAVHAPRGCRAGRVERGSW
jgi:outer membrane protein OmpA-like peptidoglycan-associated protein